MNIYLFQTMLRTVVLMSLGLSVAHAGENGPKDCIEGATSYSSAHDLNLQPACYQQIIQQLDVTCKGEGLPGLCQLITLPGACLANHQAGSNSVDFFFDFPINADFGFHVELINKNNCQFTVKNLEGHD